MKYYAPNTDRIFELTEKTLPLYSNSWLIPLEHFPEIKPNSSIKDGFQYVWDSVSLSAYQKCPRYYNWTIRDGYHLYPIPTTLTFGIHFHTCMETWHKLLATGLSKEEALLRCTKLALLLGESLPNSRKERTKETLTRAVVWYLDQFKTDNAETTLQSNNLPAVEYSFKLPLFEIFGIKLYISGHIDRIVNFLGDIYITDYKTTKLALDEKFFASFKPNTQVANYLLAAKILAGTTTAIPSKPKGIIIDGIQLGVNFNRFSRSIINYSTMEIESHIKDLESTLIHATIDAQNNHFPANPTSCVNQYGKCVFHEICSSTPAKHARMLKSSFVQSTWDPNSPR